MSAHSKKLCRQRLLAPINQRSLRVSQNSVTGYCRKFPKAIFVVVPGRVLPIECKVSNSEVNSFKRLIHEAAGKAVKWINAFGRRAIVPAAVLSGCYKVENLMTAQDQGLAIFWTHDLEPLKRFLAEAC